MPPLTVGQKFKLITRSSFDPAQFVWYGLISGIGQAENSESAYGQGWGAYGKRYATTMADGTVEGYMVSGIFPSVLKQDPRYFIMGKGTVVHRTMYALSRLFITRSDSGRAEFNASEIFGSASAAAISTYGYHPENDKDSEQHSERVGHAGCLRRNRHRHQRILAGHPAKNKQEARGRSKLTRRGQLRRRPQVFFPHWSPSDNHSFH